MNTTTNNQTRKFLYGTVLVGMILSLCLGVGGSSTTARAQEVGTDTPQPEVTETSLEISSPVMTDTAIPEFTGTPETGRQGASCSSPVVFDDQWANGYRLVCQNNLYVLMVDLTNPAIKVDVKAAPSGTHTLDWYADSNTIAVINADYQYSPCPSGAICSNGLTISNGSSPTDYTNLDKLCNDGYVRRQIGFSQDQRVVIDWWYKFVSDSQARAWCDSRNTGHWPLPGQGGGLEEYSYNVVGAGPQFTFDGTFKWECGDGSQNQNCPGSDVVINGEHFKSGNWWNRPQSAIGYSSDGTTLALAESNYAQHTMQDVHDIMYQRLSAYGKTLKSAFKFDGGSVAGFWYYNSTYSSTPNVYVPNVIRIQRTNSTCYSLSTNINPGGSGNISINTPSNCAQGKYTPGTSVQLTANANSGYTFSNWSGDAGGFSNPTTVTMTSAKSVTANFSSIQPCYTLTLTHTGSGSDPTSSPANSSGCSTGQYLSGESITLTASPTSGWIVSSWSGTNNDSSTSTTNIVTMPSSNRTITANYILRTCPTITRWKGEYWSNTSLSDPVALCRDDQTIDFDWGLGSPDSSIPSDNFSARWTRSLDFAAGTYIFHLRHDDGARLYIDDVLKLDAWTTCCVSDTVQVQLQAGQHTIRMEMFENTGAANAGLWWEPAIIYGWKGEYYNNETFSGNPAIVRDDPVINFEWGPNAPDPMVLPDHFSIRWTRTVYFLDGSYIFTIMHDDGARLYIDNNMVFENWCGDCVLTETVTRYLTTGTHLIKLEMRENSGYSSEKLSWQSLTPISSRIYLPLVIR